MIDFYFSYRSPYSYLILPRMLKLKNEYNLDINFKIVYPLAIRMPEWFKNKNIFFFVPFIMDFKKKAKKLNIPLNMPIKPDPIRQNTITGKISSHQPYIFDVCHMGQVMSNRGKGIEFAFELSTLIWSVKNWNNDSLLEKVFAEFGEDLYEVRKTAKKDESRIIDEIKNNQEDQKIAGHHGVPLNVYKGKYYFGQDDPFEELIDELVKDNIIDGF
jgi:2-hydroxychromene-2-carboxylate isomerase|tara:strand:- start:767 stop:1411 length:645 start_codon:yes stop_codon:yes gene_type:complete